MASTSWWFWIWSALVLLILLADDTEGWRQFKRRRHGRLFRRTHFNSRWRPSFWPWGSLDLSWTTSGVWWEGPNVCTHTEQKNDSTLNDLMGHFMSTTLSCDDKETSYICTKTEVINGEKTTTKEIKECCHGYKRPRRGPGCTVSLKLENIVKTANSLNLTEFVRAARSVGLEDDLQNATQAKFTIFAPRNEAFNNTSNLISSYDVMINDMNSVIRISPPISTLIVNDASDLVLGHVTGGILSTSRLQDEQIVTTANSKSSTVRVNFYDKADKRGHYHNIMTANCKRVMSRDNMATNGVIHVVEEVLTPVYKSLTDLVSSYPQLSYLKTILGHSTIGHDLRLDGQYTLFAPTDNAFKNLDPQLLSRITTDQRCLKKIVYNHLLPNVICSTAIPRSRRSRTKNMLSGHVQLTRDQDDKIFVEKSQIIDRDIMATNGVLHLIDDVIIPDEAYGVMDVLKMRNITKFAELIVQADLKKTLKLSENITIFAPTDEAFSKMTEFAKKRLNDSGTALADVLQYHVVPETSSCRAPNNYRFPTWNKKRNLTVHSFYYFGLDYHKTIQCSSIVKLDIPSCNAVIHLIDQVLIPPIGSVTDVMASDKRFSEFLKLIKNSGLADRLNENGPFTVLAPTNTALAALSEIEMNKLQESTDSLEEFVMRHIHQGHKCCSELRWLRRRVSRIPYLAYGISRQIILGSSEITECDMVGTNGVVHAVGKVIQEEDADPLDGLFSFLGF